MIKKYVCYWEEDSEWGGDYHRYEELVDKDTDKTVYSVCNLTDCPEDAIILRSLVSAEEILKYIRIGMDLCANGYGDVELEYVKLDK